MSPFISELESIASTVIVDGFKAAIAELPALEGILSTLVKTLGSASINWATLLTTVLDALPGGPMAVIVAILTNLTNILVHPSATIVAAAKVLIELHNLHAV